MFPVPQGREKRAPVESVVSGLRSELMRGGRAVLVAVAPTLALCTQPSEAPGPRSMGKKDLPAPAQEPSSLR